VVHPAKQIMKMVAAFIYKWSQKKRSDLTSFLFQTIQILQIHLFTFDFCDRLFFSAKD